MKRVLVLAIEIADDDDAPAIERTIKDVSRLAADEYELRGHRANMIGNTDQQRGFDFEIVTLPDVRLADYLETGR